MARPQKKLSTKLVEQLAKAQLTNVEIAQICHCSEDTLVRRYAERLKAWKSQGVGSVRRELFRTAMGKSRMKASAMIFFLKNYGDMRDVVAAKVSGTVTHEVVDLSKLSDEELSAVEKLIESASTAPAESGTDKG